MRLNPQWTCFEKESDLFQLEVIYLSNLEEEFNEKVRFLISEFKFIPKQMKEELPFINVHKGSIKEGLKYVLEMPREDLLELAIKSRNFVLKWHDPIAIANRMIGVIKSKN